MRPRSVIFVLREVPLAGAPGLPWAIAAHGGGILPVQLPPVLDRAWSLVRVDFAPAHRQPPASLRPMAHSHAARSVRTVSGPDNYAGRGM
jgi:hypothetical protein